ncbi:MAG: hypothetical protein ACE5H2_02770 [Terriglobia bacterium]
MKFMLVPKKKIVLPLWDEFEDVFGVGPVGREHERLRAKHEKLLERKGKILGMKPVDVYSLTPAERRKMRKPRRSDRNKLRWLDKELKETERLLAEWPEASRPKTWSWEEQGTGYLQIVHKITRRKRKRIVARVYAQRGEDGSVVVRLKPSKNENVSKMFSEFCYLVHSRLEGMWEAIRLQK